MSEAVLELAVAIVVAVCAALLAYVLSVSVTRKGALHDAKLAAYSRISGLYGETLQYYQARVDLLEIDPDEDDKLGRIEKLFSMLDDPKDKAPHFEGYA